ncbi:MAG: hypothetical protein WAK84_15245 [Candidatus Cybelea sp.]
MRRLAASLASDQVDVEAELRGDNHFIANRLKRLANELFVREGTVGLSGVK